MAEILLGNIKGETGSGLKILGYYTTAEELYSAVPNPDAGEAYGIGSEQPYDIYIYSQNKGWVNNGAIQGAKGDNAKITQVTANVDNTSGNPNVTVTMGGTESERTFDFSFSGLKGEIPTEHLEDTTKHITSDERTLWNSKAPGGHGLGEIGEGTSSISFQEFMQKGGGFYQAASSEDSPNNIASCLGLLQVVRSKTADAESGAQLAFHDFTPSKPQMWLRTLSVGNAGNWVELLHTGNIADHNVARNEVQTYTGNGLYGLENARTFTFSFQPKIFFISGYGCSGGNYTLTVPYGFPFAHTVVHSGDGFDTMNCEFQYSGNSITMYNTASANNGFNTDGKPYTIIAIG